MMSGLVSRDRPGRRLVLAFAVVATAFAGAIPVAVVAAAAPEPQPFTEEAFATAQKEGKPILIDTYATWCEVCARQAPILEKLRREPKFRELVTFKVNFDTQKDVMRRFNARVQSTLIVFRGGKEVGRSVGETQPEWIEDLLEKTVGESAS